MGDAKLHQLAFADAFSSALSLTAAVDGVIEDSEIALIRQMCSMLQLDEEAVLVSIEEFTSPRSEESLLEELRSRGFFFNDDMRGFIVEAAYHVANIDKVFHSTEERLLKRIADKIGLRAGAYEIALDLASETERLFEKIDDYLSLKTKTHTGIN